MKLAKKMLACAMALAMVAALALTAFAAAPVVTMTAAEYTAVGDEVTVTVSATGMTGLMSADLVFNYDAEALEFVKAAKPAGAAYDMGLGEEVGTGEATWSFMYSGEAEADSDLVVLTFKVKKAGTTTVTVKYSSWDGTDMPAEANAVIAEKVVPTTEAPTTEAPTTAAPTTEAPTTAPEIPQTGEAGVAAIAGVMALAAVAFVATRKKDEE